MCKGNYVYSVNIKMSVKARASICCKAAIPNLMA
jgi:hypothetical protein